VNPGTAALGRGLDVLAALADPSMPDGLGVVALAGRVGGDKSQVSRTLATLEERGFVERNPETLAYRLGWRVFGLAARIAESRLVAEAPPVLRGLVRELGESAHLSVRQGGQVLTLVSESPESTLHAPGSRARRPAASSRSISVTTSWHRWGSPRTRRRSLRRARSATRLCARSSSRASSPPPHRSATAAAASSPPSTSPPPASASSTAWTKPRAAWSTRRGGCRLRSATLPESDSRSEPDS
jgi:DNA-binding transcriptional ArsR family regulator